MLYDGKLASSLTTNRPLSNRQWVLIKGHLGLPDHARDDFEKLISRYFQATAAREQLQANWDPQVTNEFQQFMAASLNDRGIVIARNRGMRALWPSDAAQGCTDIEPITPKNLREIALWPHGHGTAFGVAPCRLR
jgi:hypothetical protein